MPLGSDSLKSHQVSGQAGSLRKEVTSPLVRLPVLQELWASELWDKFKQNKYKNHQGLESKEKNNL